MINKTFTFFQSICIDGAFKKTAILGDFQTNCLILQSQEHEIILHNPNRLRGKASSNKRNEKLFSRDLDLQSLTRKETFPLKKQASFQTFVLPPKQTLNNAALKHSFWVLVCYLYQVVSSMF